MIFGLASVLAVGLVLYFSRGRSFALDEWKWLVERRNWSASSLLDPDNGHLLVLPLLVYKTTAEIFGATSHLPYSLLSAALQVLCPLLLYLLARPRLGPLGALFPAVLLLFLGSGWEVMMSPATLGNQLGLCAGLGMLLCLRRGDRPGDLAATGLLAASLASFSVGIAFAAGALVETALGPERRRRIWIALGPLALYAAWWVWARKFGQSELTADGVGSVIHGVFDQLSAALAALTGLFGNPGSPDDQNLIAALRMDLAAPLVFVLAATVLLRLIRGPRPTARLWGVLTILGVYLVLVAAVLSDIRVPNASRYAYMAAVLILLVLVELAAGLRLPRWSGWLAAAVLVVALVPNVAQIRAAGLWFRQESDYNRAELAALEAARGTVTPGFVPEAGLTTFLPHDDMHFTAEQYFAANADFGSPAFSPSALANSEDAYREQADWVSARALRLELRPAGKSGSRPRRGCTRTGANPERARAVRLPPGAGLQLQAKTEARFEVRLARFGPAPTVQLQRRGDSSLKIPADRSGVPWRAWVTASAPALACRT
jgi:hypothetical protein